MSVSKQLHIFLSSNPTLPLTWYHLTLNWCVKGSGGVSAQFLRWWHGSKILNIYKWTHSTFPKQDSGEDLDAEASEEVGLFTWINTWFEENVSDLIFNCAESLYCDNFSHDAKITRIMFLTAGSEMNYMQHIHENLQ